MPPKEMIGFFLLMIAGLALFVGTAWQYAQSLRVPESVRAYQELIRELEVNKLAFVKKHPDVLGNWETALNWMATRITYVSPEIPLPGDPKEFDSSGKPISWWEGERAHHPEDILAQKTDATGKVYETAIGRCGEFSILFMQILICQEQKAYFLMGLHEGGDHVWVEIDAKPHNKIIDVTEAVTWRQGEPFLVWIICDDIGTDPKRVAYGTEWIYVYRISKDEIVNVTDSYNGVE